VLVLFFLSGLTGLVYEVVWLRQLVLIFGSTLYATSTILCSFMGGLALGAYVGGRFMDRSPTHPLRLYGVLEIGVGLYALAVPALLRGLTPLYQILWEAGGSGSFVLFGLAKFVGIGAVLLPPTVLMGASLPVLSRWVADDPQRIGGTVGRLYAINTFGAVSGTFLAGFVVLPNLGMTHTLWVNAALNLGLGVVALVLAHAGGNVFAAASPPPPGQVPPPRPHRVARAAILVFALSGFGAMLLEVAWMRGLALVFGSSVYAFSLMLVAFLLGHACGSAAFSALLRRRPALDPGVLLAALLAAAGGLAFVTAFVLQMMPRLFAETYFAWPLGPGRWFLVQFAFSLLLMFPTTFALGGVFPVVLQIHARGIDGVARSVGTVYASNTAGTIAGAAAGGFLVVPWLGVADTVAATAALEIVLGLVLAGVTPLRRSARVALAAPMLVLLCLVPWLRPGWNVLLMNSGFYWNVQDLPKGTDWNGYLGMILNSSEVLLAKEGHTASVLVARQPGSNNVYLSVSGKVEASSESDLETQLMVSHLPLLLHADPEDVLVIGLASGISVGAAASHDLRSIRVVEVEATVVEAARFFSDANGNVLDDPRLQVSINDARNELQFSTHAYDVIASQPSNPWMTVASNLFTEDFFRLARTRLKPGGIFCQWIQTYSLRPEDLRSILVAFHAVFPHVLVFDTLEGVDLLLLGSEEAVRIDLERLAHRMADPRVGADLARANVDEPLDIVTLLRAGDREVDRLVEEDGSNTDDNARVEFSAPKALFLDTQAANLAMLDRLGADPVVYVSHLPGRDTEDRIRLHLAEAWLARGERDRAASAATSALAGPHAAEAQAMLQRVKND